MQFSILFYFSGIFKSSRDIALKWMPLDFIDDKSALGKVTV